jgi:hypothetical protein
MVEWTWIPLSGLAGVLIGAKVMVWSLKHHGFLDKDY